MSPALDRSTVAIHAGRGPRSSGAPLNAPLVLASSYHGSGYAREEGSPSWEALEAAIGALEGGESVAFASGTAAAAAILETLPAGARVVGPAAGLRVDAKPAGRARGDGRDRAADRRHDRHGGDAGGERRAPTCCGWRRRATRCWRSPSSTAVRARRPRVAVDSTFATPLLQRPLELGAALSLHSETKFIGGHSDLLLGVVSTRDERCSRELRHARAQFGATPGALEAFLALRGLRTLPVRLELSQRTTLTLATRLSTHPAVSAVHYPGLDGDPGHGRAARFMDGFGAMLSFELHGGADLADSVCARVEVFTHAKSLGGVESLIDRRARFADAPASLLRVSVGCEHAGGSLGRPRAGAGLDLRLVLAEDLAQRAADLADGGVVLERLADRRQQVVAALGGLLELVRGAGR